MTDQDQDFDTNDSMNPGVPELLQEDQDHELSAPVRVLGSVRTHELPARIGFSRQVFVNSTTIPPESLPADPRRKYVVIYCRTHGIFLGHDKQMVIDGTAAFLDSFVTLRLDTSDQLWFRGDNAANTEVNYWVGQWAD